MRGAAEDRIAAFENLGAALAVLRRLWELRLDDDVRREVTEAVQKLSVEQSRLHDRIQADKQAEKQLAARSEGRPRQPRVSRSWRGGAVSFRPERVCIPASSDNDRLATRTNASDGHSMTGGYRSAIGSRPVDVFRPDRVTGGTSRCA